MPWAPGCFGVVGGMLLDAPSSLGGDSPGGLIGPMRMCLSFGAFSSPFTSRESISGA